MAPLLHELRERLLRAGVAPRHVRRYLNELEDHLSDLRAEEQRAGSSTSDADSTALLRLGSLEDLADAMTAQPNLRSWCVRAPWAAFGLVPLLLLAGAYFVACLILWSGWHLFLPASETPFVKIQGFEIIYFGIGRSIYFGAPILIGWGVGLIAARQRLSPLWPAVALVLIAVVGATAHVRAIRPAVPGEAGHIGMILSLGTSVQTFNYHLYQALVVVSLTAVPYFIWRLQKARSLRA